MEDTLNEKNGNAEDLEVVTVRVCEHSENKQAARNIRDGQEQNAEAEQE